jgi:hypothetical protein
MQCDGPAVTPLEGVLKRVCQQLIHDQTGWHRDIN